jgi:hypothetical protein
VGDEVTVDAAAPAVLATVLLTGEAAASGSTPAAPQVTVTGAEARVRWHGASGEHETVVSAPATPRGRRRIGTTMNLGLRRDSAPAAPSPTER